MPRSLLNDPEHWRARAEETRTTAETVNDPVAKASLHKVADEYEELARQAEQRPLQK